MSIAAQALLELVKIEVSGPTFDDRSDDPWKRDAAHWVITLTNGTRTYTTDYWTGSGIVTYRKYRRGGRLRKNERVVYNHYGPGQDAAATPKPPELVDLLSNLSMDAQLGDQPFEEFCADLGYDVDSRKAHATWEQCLEVRFALRTLFGGHFDTFINTDWEEISCSSD